MTVKKIITTCGNNLSLYNLPWNKKEIEFLQRICSCHNELYII